MRRNRIEIEYCLSPVCVGNEGVEVLYSPATLEEPSYPNIDSCPACGSMLGESPICWEEIDGGILDALPSRSHGVDIDQLDMQKLLNDIYMLLVKQGVIGY